MAWFLHTGICVSNHAQMSKITTLNRFRIVKLPEALQKEFDLCQPLCADPEGMPFLEGQTFYAWVTGENACEPATAYNYLNAVLSCLTFLWEGSPSLRYTAPAEQIRQRMRVYLKDKLGCVVRPHRAGNFTVRVTKTITAPSARLCLTALRRFYYCATLKGWYGDPNPLEWTTRLASEREFKPQMPPRSGMTLPADRKGRVPDTYFCVVSGEWHPRILDDPQLRQRLLPAFTHTRDRVIARILFDSGARVGEVVGLTLGDWQRCGQRERALTTNKGSHGERVKEIWWSADTAQLLRNYLNQERRHCDRAGRRLEALRASAPLFLTEQGTPYTYAAFYANWQKACEKAGLKLTPHQIRHWYVTMALRLIESQPDDIKRAAYRQSLIAYMHWQNPETLQAYDHHLHTLDFAPAHAALARLGEDTDPAPAGPLSPLTLPEGMNVITEAFERFLSDGFGWK